MNIRHVSIKVIFVIVIVFVVGVLTVQRTQDAGFEWFANSEQEVSPVNKIVYLTPPRLPDNATREIFETTPTVVRPSVQSASTPSVPVVTATVLAPAKTLHIVPFISQAPTGKWFDARFQDGCEEASVLMAMRWVQGKGLTAVEAEKEIVAMSDYEQKTFGNFHDTSAHDTLEHLVKMYFEHSNAEVRYDISADDIRLELEFGSVVIVPADGRLLGNPYYTPPGPEHHMLVVIGYDPAMDEFITNDPGTRRGEGFRYDAGVFETAIRDYPTGNHEPFLQDRRTAMIVVRK